MPIRFHLDEHLSPSIAKGLRAHGIDVTTSQEASLLGRDDDDQLSFAVAERRVLVTNDRGFPRIHAAGARHFGICYCHPQKYSIGETLRVLLLVSQCLTEVDMTDRLEFL